MEMTITVVFISKLNVGNYILFLVYIIIIVHLERAVWCYFSTFVDATV